MNTSDHFFSNERTSPDTDYLYFSNVLSSKRKKTDLETAKESLLLKVHSLEMAIREWNTVTAIQAVNKHVQAAITMLEALKDSDKILPIKISPNANSERQTTFFSTKKQDKHQQHYQSHRDRIATYVNQRLQKKSLYFVVLVLKRMTAIMPMLKSAGFGVISVLCSFIYHAHY